jgi:hypothetical protein
LREVNINNDVFNRLNKVEAANQNFMDLPSVEGFDRILKKNVG